MLLMYIAICNGSTPDFVEIHYQEGWNSGNCEGEATLHNLGGDR